MVESPKVGEKYYFLHFYLQYRIDLVKITGKHSETFSVQDENGETWIAQSERLYETKEEAKRCIIMELENEIESLTSKIFNIKSL
jgi:hypothetical protein